MSKHYQNGADSCACGEVWPCRKQRTIRAVTALKAGDHVWRVIDHVDGWYVASVKLKTASDRQLLLERPFPFSFGVKFKPDALGLLFFATAEGALHRFIEEAEKTILWANRRIVAANKAAEWARIALQHMEHLDDRCSGQG